MKSNLLIFKKILFYFIFRERGREGEKARNINVWLPLACPLRGTWPATQACALTGNRTWFAGSMLNPLSHTTQGRFIDVFYSLAFGSYLKNLCQTDITKIFSYVFL